MNSPARILGFDGKVNKDLRRFQKEKFDCRTCGACCVSFQDQDAFCDVTEQDLKRMGRKARSRVLGFSLFDFLTARISGYGLPACAIQTQWRRMSCGPFKGVDVCTCWFLRGSLFHRVSCRIYACRPQACRNAVKPGDRSCRKIRRMLKEVLDE